MKNKRRNHCALFKAKVALEDAKGNKTMEELDSEFGVHHSQIKQWEMQIVESMKDIFSRRRERIRHQQDEVTVHL